jgi:hypothetical protein
MISLSFARASTLLLVLSIIPPVASGQSPFTVSVRVEVVFQRYRDDFDDPQAVEAAAAKLFTEYLNREVGFLRFVAGDTISAYSIVLQLDRKDRDVPATAFSELGFHARLDGPGGSAQKYWLFFRDGTLAATPNPEDFQADLARQLAHADSKTLREEILQQVPMTETALPSRSPLGWALPFRQLDLCMRNQSVLKFVNEVEAMEHVVDANVVGTFPSQGGLSPDLQPFVGGMFATNLQLPAALKQAIDEGSLRVKRVLVTTYLHDANACAHRLPGSEGAGGTP